MHWFKTRVYLDYASATPVLPEALNVVTQASNLFANPGSLHADAVAAKNVLDRSRESIAHELGCKARQVIFTSGLTESVNLAVLGFARQLECQGVALTRTHWITTSIEHSSVLESFAEIERRGGSVTHLDPDEKGRISLESLRRALRSETVFVSIGWANNEIGVVQDISGLARELRAHQSALFHTDAGQAPLYLSPQVHTLGVDLLSLGSGKLYGPRGVGALYAQDPSKLAPIIVGGGQEKGLRSGTEEVALAAGFARAFELVSLEREREAKRLGSMRDEFARELVAHLPAQTGIPTVVLNTDLKHSLPHVLNISIPGTRTGEYLALSLDAKGISVSTKSACDEGHQASHVVAALGGPSWRAINTLRISAGRDTSRRDLARALEVLVRICADGTS